MSLAHKFWRHGPVVVMGLALLGTFSLVSLPMAWKPVAFLWWGASATYALCWLVRFMGVRS